MINNIKMSGRVKIINKKETQDNRKIKIYTLTDKLKFCPEVVILAGLLKNTPPSKNNEPDRYRNVISYCQDRIEYVKQPDKCDVFVLPHKFDGINSNNYKKLLSLAKQYNKKLLCFYNDDDDKTYSIDSNVVLYRTSFYKSSKLDNELALNVLVPDFYDRNHQNELSVGFCGTIFKKNKREELLKYIKNSHLKSDIILRTDNGNRWDFEHNYSQRRKEYFDNMRNTLFTLCDRGYGNYSYRFYETMMMGRIPIIIDTDCVFPFEDKININEIGLVLKSTEIKDKESFIGSIEKYYQENKERLEEIQSNNRKIWEDYYSAEGFVENLLRNVRESKETCIKENKKSAILISSTPKYSFIWDTFFTFLRKHWTDCPYPIHFISTGDNDYLREEYNVITEKLEKDLGFLEGYRYLCKKYMDKYSHFILLQDDFLIERTVNQEIISKYENILFENENIGFIRMMPCPGPKGEQKMFGDVKLGKINKNEDYSFSYQTSFWNLKYFYDFTAPSEFRWDDFNMSKKMIIDKSGKENWGFIRPFKEWNAVYESPIPYRPTAILKGKVMDWAKPLIISKKRKINNEFDLTCYKKDKYSQRGHDGIIEKIMSELNITKGFFIEVGGCDGITLSNCRALFELGWRGCFIEGDKKYYKGLVENYKNEDIITLNKFIFPTMKEGPTLDILHKESMDNVEVDLLSIDIDGRDYEIFDNLELKPKLIIIEGGFAFHPCLREKIPYEIARFNVQQPLYTMMKLCRKKGYTPICFNQDTFLLRNDLYEKHEYFKNIKNDHVSLWESAYYNIFSDKDRNWLKNYRRKHSVVSKYEHKYYLDIEHSLDNIFDIVIPVGPNDREKIYKQIEFTKKNIIGYRNIYLVVYDKNIQIDDCITIDENIFPFNLKNVAEYHGERKRNGWYLQQLIKLYSFRCIKGILKNYLVLDSDTFFLKPITFFENNLPLYNTGPQFHKVYFEHMSKLHPSLEKVTRPSGISHHMIFQKEYLEHLFKIVEEHHGEEFWKIFLEKVKDVGGAGASEYEIYFNFMLKNYKDKIKIRKLDWTESKNLNNRRMDYVSHHWHIK